MEASAVFAIKDFVKIKRVLCIGPSTKRYSSQASTKEAMIAAIRNESGGFTPPPIHAFLRNAKIGQCTR